MASSMSLGVHSPAALPYFIAEGLLPRDPRPDQYTWETFAAGDGSTGADEELLATRTAVAWSQGRFLRNVYRFDLEGETVVQALLTTFEASPSTKGDLAHTQSATLGDSKHLGLPSLLASPSIPGIGVLADSSHTRALVVILKTKAHIYFLRGAKHIVDLPFEVEKAFAAPRGIIFQRKRTAVVSPPSTPHVPNPPPNSFFSSQLRSSTSHLHSPTLTKSSAATQAPRPRPLIGSQGLHSLLQDIIPASPQAGDEDVTNVYSLTSPLSDLGVVSYSLQQYRSRLSGKSQPGLKVEFEGLDSAEDVVYISRRDELSSTTSVQSEPLILLVTSNAETNIVTIWHAWYLEQKSLRSVLKQRAEHKASALRRRSSFLSANLGTGTATPAVRHRDGTRESFAPSVGLTGDHGPPLSLAPSRKPTRQQEEEAMASQMDPDYHPAGSQQHTRDTRRISSMNTDVRGTQNTMRTSFGARTTRRATSFGGERRSLGHRKSRGSTPGSVYSKSLGPDDESMDLDSTMDADMDELLEEAIRHIRATFETAGLENVFGSAQDDFKRELVVRKIHSFSRETSSADDEGQRQCKILTFSDPQPPHSAHVEKLNMYYHESFQQEAKCIQLHVKFRPLWPELQNPSTMPIPLFAAETLVSECQDVLALQDAETTAVLLGRNKLLFSLDDVPCSLPAEAPFRHSNPFEASAVQLPAHKEVGKNRTLDPPPRTSPYRHSGVGSSFDLCTEQSIHHRRSLKFRPREPSAQTVFGTCEAVLPDAQRRTFRRLWCEATSWLYQHPDSVKNTECDTEFVALTAAIFTFAIDLVDPKGRAALNIFRLAYRKAKATDSPESRLLKDVHESALSTTSTWSWTSVNPPNSSRRASRGSDKRQDQLLIIAAALADELTSSKPVNTSSEKRRAVSSLCSAKLVLALHIFNEEQKLCTLSRAAGASPYIPPIIGQLGVWLGLKEWSPTSASFQSYDGVDQHHWAHLKSSSSAKGQMPTMERPVGIFDWFEHCLKHGTSERYPSLATVAQVGTDYSLKSESKVALEYKTPRSVMLSSILTATNSLTADPAVTVEAMVHQGLTSEIMETLPESIAAPFKEAIARCEKQPPTTWHRKLTQLVGRDDLVLDTDVRAPSPSSVYVLAPVGIHAPLAVVRRDVSEVAHRCETDGEYTTREAGRNAVSGLIFHEDRSYVDTLLFMHFAQPQVAECARQPEWEEGRYWNEQRKIMLAATTRMIALPAGHAMIYYDSQEPLLTEKFSLPGFNSSCIMLPMHHTLTLDRTGLTEEKVNWAYFHAGVSSGLHISRKAKGIDTSWIAFNKPAELTNRHAGLLLALGLGGHLRNLAKWLSFKYLTPKHTMTSVGLLLGLSASNLGTMDSLVTRMLSVHITRMLPPGAAELNVSPATQTTGLLGIGLLYYNTQHRRMSEIMLSEVELMEAEDPDNGPELLRDESYRLAAGFALGLINLGKGNNLRGLHGMRLPERLLTMAVGSRPIHAVHVFDRATAGAVIAIALVYMKSGDRAIANKIDIPDTEAQFDQVRPDILMLRAMAKHLILWDEIEARESGLTSRGWILDNLPACYKDRAQQVMNSMLAKHTIDSAYIPLFNVFTGLAYALALKYAGSGNKIARDDVLDLLRFFHRLSEGADAFYFDGKLGRGTLRRCMDILALSAATIMSGTGDLATLRYLRRMHGRVDEETSYGSHMAAHLALGALFLGGGTYTFGTSDLAIAALLCAFYPLFPTEVQDNRVHLQAFRHLWVLAAEARCIVIEDIDTQRPIQMPIKLTLKDGTIRHMRSPCLLPDLNSISAVQTDDSAYWRITLDFASNPSHLAAFRADQRVFVRRCPAGEAYSSTFASALAALNDTQSTQAMSQIWHSVMSLPAFKTLDNADIELVLPPDIYSSVYTLERGSVVDDRLSLSRATTRSQRDELWNLRVLFVWAERARDHGDGKLRWLGHEVVEDLRARIEQRAGAVHARL